MLLQTRLQLPRGSGSPELFRGLYDGVLPPLLAGLPSGMHNFREGVARQLGSLLMRSMLTASPRHVIIGVPPRLVRNFWEYMYDILFQVRQG